MGTIKNAAAVRTLIMIKLSIILKIDLVFLEERRAFTTQPVRILLYICSVSMEERDKLAIIYRKVPPAFI